uniref:Uncharacterized protein n=1 Tax=Rhizophora mucronata TaxID=61149 RepID=A0A2P2MXF8_RHIMU
MVTGKINSQLLWLLDTDQNAFSLLGSCYTFLPL